MLITNLKLVWFELGDIEKIKTGAIKGPNIEIEEEEELIKLLIRLREVLMDTLDKCDVVNNNQVLEIHCEKDKEEKKLNVLHWIFECELVDQVSTDDSFISGPDILFDEFMKPSLCFTNHYCTQQGTSTDRIKNDLLSLDTLSLLSNQRQKDNIPHHEKNLIVQQPKQDLVLKQEATDEKNKEEKEAEHHHSLLKTEDPIELPPTDSFKEIEKEMTAEKVNAMNEIVKDMERSGYQVITHVFKTDSSHACTVLIDYLNSKSMDCLIMGSRNLSGWKRFFMGSFSDYVQCHVNCPVLIIK
ncbi:hypothetical protein G6F46_011314 [Rhizopus delemar]|uniref:UspA domain-containing protein n=2 Tax=Rhizopus TaxID=4842 RepID=A0A9P6YTZ3_9FUNG|nr:hypothetical protein G6F55_009377 [Rhizopus delemar]KAG1535679.1 hypothetical protein G6F51_011406 [Rhizopus arrhizus]KAG1489983.1 hypothetical protein G6F54_011049 [Rhizopus delemar]KAG1500914.1 hypothetical protein G6F53_011204 [Rhizopus delemar]KAG1518180.1 hypothetical protein G6F52_009079 [Rhizopus delemar]